MLVDPINFTHDPVTAMVSRMRGAGQGPERRVQGVYIIGHFNLDHLLPGGASFDGAGAAWHEYPSLGDAGEFSPYGVCDSPDQLLAHPLGQWIVASERRFTVSLTCIRKADEPAQGGWRWHKWGEYIGDKSPQYEYLYDEGPDIAAVYCFHVYECLDASQSTVPERFPIGTIFTMEDDDDGDDEC
jgi:hypothetical protein